MNIKLPLVWGEHIHPKQRDKLVCITVSFFLFCEAVGEAWWHRKAASMTSTKSVLRWARAAGFRAWAAMPKLRDVTRVSSLKLKQLMAWSKRVTYKRIKRRIRVCLIWMLAVSCHTYVRRRHSLWPQSVAGFMKFLLWRNCSSLTCLMNQTSNKTSMVVAPVAWWVRAANQTAPRDLGVRRAYGSIYDMWRPWQL